MNRHDVVVVGTGLSGLTAAVRLAESGARVAILAKGIGATHLSPCFVDALGYDPERVDRPGEAIGRLTEARPDHPYARAGGADGLAAAVGWFKERFDDGPLAPYAYVGDLDANLLLPTAVGALKPSAVVPQSAAGGDLSGGGSVCVVGFRALKDFHPALLADNLARHAGIQARAATLDLVPEGRADVNALGFARAFDDPAFRAQVLAQLTGRLGADERVAFPAVLGIKDPHAVWSVMQDRLARPVFEIPTLPPSVPGMRVFATLRERLRRAGGIAVVNATVTGADVAAGRVTAVRARVGLRDAVHTTDWVVLATGGFGSAGLELGSDWRVRETALGLPVAGVPAPGEERFRPDYFDRHPMARAGIVTDTGLRPLDADGARVYDNVLVTGATLAGAEPWKEKSGDGISLATGHRAAEAILEATGIAARPAPLRAGG